MGTKLICWVVILKFEVCQKSYVAQFPPACFRLTEEEEFKGADLSIHGIDAYPEEHVK